MPCGLLFGLLDVLQEVKESISIRLTRVGFQSWKGIQIYQLIASFF